MMGFGRISARLGSALVVLLAALLFADGSSPRGAGAQGLVSKPTRLVLLGTGSPTPDPERAGPSLAVLVNDRAYLVDCGVGCVRQAVRAARGMGLPALESGKLQVVFFTHMHSDHTLGYPDLMLTTWDHRDKPLEVYGPKGIAAMTQKLLEAFAEDIQVRTAGLQQSDPTTLKPNVHEIQPGEIYKDGHVTVSAFLVKHGSFAAAFGLKFVTADRTIVVSGDTAPTPAIVEQARGVDVLVHEVYSQAKFAKMAPNIQQYLLSFHTSTRQLAELADQARPRLVVLTHKLGYHGLPEDTILKELREAGYRGKAVNGRDLGVY